jgi:hypothetical protein
MVLSVCGQVICLYLCTTVVCNRSADKGTDAMSQNPSSERASSSTSQEIPPHFVEPESSLRHSQEPATCFDREPDQSSPLHLHSIFLEAPTDLREWLLDAIEKLRKTLVLSVCLSVRMEQLVSHWTDFLENLYLGVCRKYANVCPENSSFSKI